MRKRAILMRRRWAVAVLAAAVVLSACSSKTSSVTPSNPTSTAPTTHGPNVRAMLLSLSDMPNGWVALSTNTSDTLVGCGVTSALSSGKLPSTNVSYGLPGGVPTWGELAADLPLNQAKEGLTRALHRIDSCHTIHSAASSGLPSITFTISPIVFPLVGDQSGALTMSASADGVDFTIYAVLARFGSVVAIFYYGNLGNDESAFKGLVSKASAKIMRVLQ